MFQSVLALCALGVSISNAYQVFTNDKSWADADLHCSDKYGVHLASIHNEETNNKIGDLLYNTAGETYGWIGFDALTNTWTDSTPYDYNPGFIDSIHAECTAMLVTPITDLFSDKKWTALPCNNQYPFICNMRVAGDYQAVLTSQYARIKFLSSPSNSIEVIWAEGVDRPNAFGEYSDPIDGEEYGIGYVDFPDDTQYDLYYYPDENTIYWDGLRDETANIWIKNLEHVTTQPTSLPTPYPTVNPSGSPTEYNTIDPTPTPETEVSGDCNHYGGYIANQCARYISSDDFSMGYYCINSTHVAEKYFDGEGCNPLHQTSSNTLECDSLFCKCDSFENECESVERRSTNCLSGSYEVSNVIINKCIGEFETVSSKFICDDNQLVLEWYRDSSNCIGDSPLITIYDNECDGISEIAWSSTCDNDEQTAQPTSTPGLTPEPTPDDSAIQGVLNCGDSISDATVQAGDIDYYLVNIPNDEHITSSSYSVLLDSCGSEYDTYLYFYSDEWVQLAECDDCGGCGVQAQLTVSPISSGQYILGIGGYSHNFGAYDMHITCTNLASTSTSAPDTSTSTSQPQPPTIECLHWNGLPINQCSYDYLSDRSYTIGCIDTNTAEYQTFVGEGCNPDSLDMVLPLDCDGSYCNCNYIEYDECDYVSYTYQNCTGDEYWDVNMIINECTSVSSTDSYEFTCYDDIFIYKYFSNSTDCNGESIDTEFPVSTCDDGLGYESSYECSSASTSQPITTTTTITNNCPHYNAHPVNTCGYYSALEGITKAYYCLDINTVEERIYNDSECTETGQIDSNILQCEAPFCNCNVEDTLECTTGVQVEVACGGSFDIIEGNVFVTNQCFDDFASTSYQYVCGDNNELILEYYTHSTDCSGDSLNTEYIYDCNNGSEISYYSFCMDTGPSTTSSPFSTTPEPTIPSGNRTIEGMLNCGDLISGATVHAGDIDYYLVNIPTASDGAAIPYSILFDSCGSEHDTYLYFYNNEWSLLSECDDCGNCGLQGELRVSPIFSGEYILGIGGFHTEFGTYHMEVTCTNLPSTTTSEPTTSPPIPETNRTVQGILNCGDFVTDATTAAYEIDYYFVNIPDDINSVVLDSCGSEHDTYLYFYNDEWQQLDECDDCGDCGLQGQLTVSPISSGQYILGIGGFSTRHGAYRMEVTCSNEDITSSTSTSTPFSSTSTEPQPELNCLHAFGFPVDQCSWGDQDRSYGMYCTDTFTVEWRAFEGAGCNPDNLNQTYSFPCTDNCNCNYEEYDECGYFSQSYQNCTGDESSEYLGIIDQCMNSGIGHSYEYTCNNDILSFKSYSNSSDCTGGSIDTEFEDYTCDQGLGFEMLYSCSSMEPIETDNCLHAMGTPVNECSGYIGGSTDMSYGYYCIDTNTAEQRHFSGEGCIDENLQTTTDIPCDDPMVCNCNHIDHDECDHVSLSYEYCDITLDERGHYLIVIDNCFDDGSNSYEFICDGNILTHKWYSNDLNCGGESADTTLDHTCSDGNAISFSSTCSSVLPNTAG